MKFHEDIIFKNEGQTYGQELIGIMKIEGKIVEVHPTEYAMIDPKMYKPDLVFELEDKIIILEFQSSYVNTADKRRFRFYSALFDNIKNKSKKPIEVHVLSTVEREKTKCYKLNSESRFPIYIHTLKSYNSNEFINNIKIKIKDNKELDEKELLLISLLCFMESNAPIENTLLDSADIITNIPNLNQDIAQFVKGIILMLCDKFVEDELINQRISNLVGGNMKIVEDYAKRVAKREVRKIKEELKEKNVELEEKNVELEEKNVELEEKNVELEEKNEELESSKKNFVINLDNEGYNEKDIARLANVSLEFVKKTLSS